MPDNKEDFQKQTNEYSEIAIANIREMVEAMEHANECRGDCEDCNGAGETFTDWVLRWLDAR